MISRHFLRTSTVACPNALHQMQVTTGRHCAGEKEGRLSALFRSGPPTSLVCIVCYAVHWEATLHTTAPIHKRVCRDTG
jgi:hypothetical protein